VRRGHTRGAGQVVSLPTADERKRMEAAGRSVVDAPYGEKVRRGAGLR
jgi:hypothetical protein